MSVARLAVASLKRDYTSKRGFYAGVALDALAGLAMLGVFRGLAEMVAPSSEGLNGQHYFGFVVMGLIVVRLAQTGLTTHSGNVRLEQSSGTFEILVSGPARPAQVMLGGGSYPLLQATVTSLFLFVAAFPLGMRLDTSVAGMAVAVVAFALLTLFVQAIGLLVAASVLLVRQAAALTGITSAVLTLISGAYFPLDVLPQPLRAIGAASPLTWGLETIRQGMLAQDVAAWSLIGLAAVTPAAMMVAMSAFDRAILHERRTGGLSRA